ncbi:Uncharacterised protein [Mycobacteroides abscessus subsp. abscessus]|nr:Uncharacterised protein [Mycobacteroides abscessus subsp. abscessus]SHY69027.1 Uncharacterised protein [Mycobacteroides abscessus subsp. abscessus]SIB55737.1 Uncharacterised protein [Mycobacteroides abscessus subsp. abscessus]SIB65776.1 Uncharacterised protein [Mycobacteroides abscessus subsp. abscessus]SIC19409.1 Uncharacterised protein [Mycobacteroides abscessus subsp. abscessus]
MSIENRWKESVSGDVVVDDCTSGYLPRRHEMLTSRKVRGCGRDRMQTSLGAEPEWPAVFLLANLGWVRLT